MSVLKRFLYDESGATAIEYGLIAVGLSILIIGATNSLGKTLRNTFQIVTNQLAAQ